MLVTAVMSLHSPLKDLFIMQLCTPETWGMLNGMMCENLSQGQEKCKYHEAAESLRGGSFTCT